MKSFKTEVSKRLINIIRLKGPISQTQLTQVTGLSPSTVSNAAKRLLEGDWIQEERRSSTGGRGRPHVFLRASPNAAFAIGIDVGGQNMRAGLVNLAGEILHSINEKTRPDEGPENILQRVKKMVRQVIADSPILEEKIDGLGLGLSGVVDSETGTCLFCPNLPGWIDIPVAEIFSKEFGGNVIVDDSVRMVALADKYYGHGQNIDNLIYICLGIGIGCAIFIQGNLYRGHKGLAGEFGHITVDETGPLCHCGNLGCLEALASAEAIVHRTREAIQSGVYSSISAEIDNIYQNIDVLAIASAIKAGDKLAFDILDKTGEYIGIGIAALINLLNPSTIIIGGGVAQVGEVLLSSIRRTVKRRALGMLSREVPIQQSQLIVNAGIIGGAAAVFDRIMS